MYWKKRSHLQRFHQAFPTHSAPLEFPSLGRNTQTATSNPIEATEPPVIMRPYVNLFYLNACPLWRPTILPRSCWKTFFTFTGMLMKSDYGRDNHNAASSPICYSSSRGSRCHFLCAAPSNPLFPCLTLRARSRSPQLVSFTPMKGAKFTFNTLPGDVAFHDGQSLKIHSPC